MCTGLELALLAGGVGASVGGGLISRNEQTNNEVRQAAARNQQLRDTLTRQRQFSDQNAQVLAETVGRFNRPAQEAVATGAETARETSAINNMQPAQASVDEIPLGGNAPTVVKSKIAGAMSDAFSKATDLARKRAKLGAYADLWGGNDRGTREGGMRVDTTNNLSRGEASILPAMQDLAAYSVWKPSSGIGETLAAIGNIMAGFGGRGFSSGAAPSPDAATSGIPLPRPRPFYGK